MPRAAVVVIARDHTDATFARIGRELSGRHYSSLISMERRGRSLLPYPPFAKHYAAALKHLSL
jgi:chromosomal replication initiation ATPase DnaA